MAKRPWRGLVELWPSPVQAKDDSDAAYAELCVFQREFLEKHGFALWERTHWFPIRPVCGKNEQERKALTTERSRRKRRQLLLKEGLEKGNSEMKRIVSKKTLESSVFSTQSQLKILEKPRTWHLENGDEAPRLLDQMRQLDQAEPDRNRFYYD